MKTYNCCSVYIHTNKTNGKVYIGMTTRPVEKRWQNGKGYHSMRFGRAIKKYGWDGFDHIVVASDLLRQDAFKLEKELIDKYDATNPANGYNEALGGGGGGMYNKHHTNEAKQKISQFSKERGFTEEHKKHISEAKSGAKHHRAKPVYQYDLDGKLIKVWEYASLATKQLGINKGNIGEVCYGRRKTAGGFVWSYEAR